MKKQMVGLLSLVMVFTVIMAGCGNPSKPSDSSGANNPDSSLQSDVSSGRGTADFSSNAAGIPDSEAAELVVRFGDEGSPFTMYLENNSTAAAIAGYVGTSEWRLPIYNYDESDVMQYYDIPSQYEIPDNSAAVTEAHAGDVFYSNPNRIVLFYHDKQISEEYTKIGTFETTDAFISAVEDNPVLEGWSNKIVRISPAE